MNKISKKIIAGIHKDLEVEFTNQLPDDWTYSKSIKKVKRIKGQHAKITKELLRELHITHEVTSKRRGWRYDLRPNEPKLSWQNYCDTVAIPVSTANRWLREYDIETGEKSPPATSKPRRKILHCLPEGEIICGDATQKLKEI